VEGFSCPDCNGVLWAIQDGGLQRFRCRVGHAWSPESLLIRQSEALEAALWIALRSLEERAALARRLAEPARRRGHTITATRFEEQASEAQQAARVVRTVLLDRDNLVTVRPLPGDRQGQRPRDRRRGPVAELENDQDLEVLLDYLRRSRGFDFTGYKRTTLGRRIEKRMQVVGADSYLSYLDHLQVDPEEFTQLFNTILINVTSFFRDPPTWEYLAAEVLPRILADKGEDEPVRI
jgi:CheR methyltransferase, all-alpha domain